MKMPVRGGFRFSCLVVVTFVLRSSGAGQMWEVLPNGPVADARHDDVFFLNPDRGWVVNGEGQVHRTTDGGDSWEHLSTIPTYARCVGFTDSLHGWIGTLTGGSGECLFATDDGGHTWNPVTDFSGPPPESVCGMSVVNDSVIYGSGAYYGVPRVIKTTDGGLNWHSLALDSLAGALVDCHFFTPDSGIVVGSTAVVGFALILSTTDGGNTWRVNLTGSRSQELCWKISFPTPDMGYASIEDFSQPGQVYFLRTSDHGMTWEEKIFLNTWRDSQGIGFATETLGWMGGWSGETYETTDGGETWHVGGPGLYVNRFRFFGDSLGYCVGNRVYRYSNDSISTSVPGPQEPVSLGYELRQNYPNPFNPATTIRFLLPDMVRVRLAVFDLLGREVALILDEVRSAGEHVTGWDGRDNSGARVASGVYLYRLQTPDRILSRKLMLVW